MSKPTGLILPARRADPIVRSSRFVAVDTMFGGVSIGTRATSADTLYLSPIAFPVAQLFDQVAVEVTSAGTASSAARIGLYQLNGSATGVVLLHDWGTIAVDSLGVKTITIAFTPSSRLVYFAGIVSNGAPTYRGATLAQSPWGTPAVSDTSVYGGAACNLSYGALASTSSIVSYTAACVRFAFRVA